MSKFKDRVITTRTQWTAKQLCEYADQCSVKFDNVVQRGVVWKNKQKSLLIHSLIENYMPPEFLANKKNGIFDMIDGKQRYNAIASFIQNKYSLVDVPDVYDTDGNRYILIGKYFKDLDEEIQNKILGRSLEISVMDNASSDVVKEYFFRRNNGTSLTAARKIFAKAKSFEEISLMQLHPIFDVMFGSRTHNNDDSMWMIMRSYVILYCDNKSLESKKVFPFIERTAFTEDGIATINKCYDTMLNVYNLLNDRNDKASKKPKRKMMVKTHAITLMPIVKYVNDNNIDVETFADWLTRFFNTTKTSISDVYNENSKAGSSKIGAVEARLKAMADDFMEFIGDNKTDNNEDDDEGND